MFYLYTQHVSVSLLNNTEMFSILWEVHTRQVLTSFQMTVSDSPVVLEVPTEKINLRSHATSSSLSTWTAHEDAS